MFNFICVFIFCSILVCGPPAVPSNSRVQTKAGPNNGFSEATYECDAGYEIFGSKTVKCDSDKGWEKEIPFCGKILITW